METFARFDLAIYLTPPTRNTDWAAGNLLAHHSEWKRQLEAIVGRHVSLEAIDPGSKPDEMVRTSGVLLWARD
jgi:hypothetical protein